MVVVVGEALAVVVRICVLIVFNVVAAVSNYRGRMRDIRGDRGVRHFIEVCGIVRDFYPYAIDLKRRRYIVATILKDY